MTTVPPKKALRLKVAIVASGQTSRAVARQAHIHEVRLSKIITGRGQITDDEMLALARVLGCRIHELFEPEAV